MVLQYVIKTYNSDPEINFDIAQATIYNSVVKQYTGNTVKPEELYKRTMNDKFDHSGMLFAFTKENEPLAYIRYYLYPSGSLYIGYPWSKPDCPSEIQEDLFNQLKHYLKQKFPDREYARMGFADNRIKPFHEFAKKKNFIKDYWEEEFYIDIEKFSSIDLGGFNYREATLADINDMISLAMEDFSFYGQEDYLTEQETKDYLLQEVFKDENCVLLLDDNDKIGFAGSLRHKEWNNSLFTFIKCESLKKIYADKRFVLYTALTKILHDKGLTDEKIFCSKSNTEKILLEQLERSPAEKKEGTSSYKVPL